VRSYDNDDRASRHLRRRARRITLRHAPVIRRAAPGVAPVRSSATSLMEGTIPHSLLGLARTSPLRRCFYAAFPSRSTPRSRPSNETSGHRWKLLPFNKWRAPYRDTDSWPLSPPAE